jgi:hypothetical protein
MARVRGVVAVSGLALCLAIGSVSPAAAANGSISGTVTDAATEAGLPQIWVCAHSFFLLGPFGGCAFTDPSGKYTIPDVPPSAYKVVIDEEGRYGYLSQWFDGKGSRGAADAVAVGDGQAVTGVDAALSPGGQISGNVTDVATGDPVEGIRACAPDAAGYPEGGVIHCGKSDAGGDYLIESLSTGSYLVEFFVEEEPNYVIQYYNGKALRSEAEPVAVTAPALTSEVDAAMREGVQITGRLTEAGSGDPVKWVSVCALNPATEALAGCDGSAEDGTYSIAGLPPASYVVSFAVDFEEDGLVLHPDGYVRQYYDGKATFAEAALVGGPSAGLYEGIDAVLTQGPEIGLRPFFPPFESSLPPLVWSGPGPGNRKPKCHRGTRRKIISGKRRCVRVHKKHHRARGAGSRRSSPAR